MSKINFLKDYFTKLSSLMNFNDSDLKKIEEFSKILIDTDKRGNNSFIFGNGGSSAIASHFSVDLTKNARVKCLNLNEYDLITCFSNDYGYERWVEKSIEFYCKKDDTIILISAGGNSLNMINGAKKAKEKKVNKIITLTGNDKENKLSKLGDINFWVDSKSYNHIENVHQAILLSIVDLIIGKSEYPPN